LIFVHRLNVHRQVLWLSFYPPSIGLRTAPTHCPVCFRLSERPTQGLVLLRQVASVRHALTCVILHNRTRLITI